MYKDVLVHLDGSLADEARLQYAETIASEWQGHITGFITNPMPDHASLVSADGSVGGAALLAEIEEEAMRRGAEVERKLAERFARLEVSGEIRRIDDTPNRLVVRAVGEARWGDIFIVGRPYGERPTPLAASLFEGILFEGGCGVLVVPPNRQPPDAFRRVLVCWRATREASRAVAQAMPFIGKAARTTVLTVDPRNEPGVGPMDPVADISRHLSRHGAQVESTILESEGRELADVILAHARRFSVDLIVMGGYGHSRTREWMLGGATRDMLTVSEFPILMAH